MQSTETELDTYICATCSHTARTHSREGKHACVVPSCPCQWFKFQKAEQLTEAQKVEVVKSICDNHVVVQHRDTKPAWCKNCGLTWDFKVPVSRLGNSEKNPIDLGEWENR